MPDARFPAILAVAATLLVSACGSEPPPKNAPASLVSDAPVPPGAARISTVEGAEAVEAVYRVQFPSDSVAAWYRRWFLEHQWRITGDNRLADGTVVLHAEGPGKPLWLMIRPEGGGTNFSVMTAEPGIPK